MPGNTGEVVLHHTLRNITILIVDNEQKIAQLVKDVLCKLGFSETLITTAEDGYVALDILKTNRMDLIICDWEMLPNEEYMKRAEHAFDRMKWKFKPNNGADFVRCLRTLKIVHNPYVPVIMLTGPTTPNHLYYARDAGVNEVLIKPIMADDLARRIVSIVEEPRDFVTCDTYRGPCRRRNNVPLPPNMPERRHRITQIIKYGETS